MSTIPEWFFRSLEFLASAATAGGVFLAWRQLKHTQEQAVTSFEDQVAREYRDIARALPVTALLGGDLSDDEYENALAVFHQYFDFSNYQVFLRSRGRVSDAAWAEWREGILQNLDRPAFRRAWKEIERRAPQSYSELYCLLAEEGGRDPKEWREGLVEDVSRGRLQAVPGIGGQPNRISPHPDS
jgi:hypothetical protein